MAVTGSVIPPSNMNTMEVVGVVLAEAEVSKGLGDRAGIETQGMAIRDSTVMKWLPMSLPATHATVGDATGSLRSLNQHII
ncbi:hypothetical protein ACJ72_01184 [Emergomyces africanus]|uniref:Uncharacterized protein n=1 Tax=Emergomyces africanus TaxID=1955775 RepID=A0A1B7P5X6_9EURO|nr:hypothetical protein ACJ72_01184 [Emergomyces africanus]